MVDLPALVAQAQAGGTAVGRDGLRGHLPPSVQGEGVHRLLGGEVVRRRPIGQPSAGESDGAGGAEVGLGGARASGGGLVVGEHGGGQLHAVDRKSVV